VSARELEHLASNAANKAVSMDKKGLHLQACVHYLKACQYLVQALAQAPRGWQLYGLCLQRLHAYLCRTHKIVLIEGYTNPADPNVEDIVLNLITDLPKAIERLEWLMRELGVVV